MKKTIYKCDPEKYKKCPKTGCYIYRGGYCNGTKHPEYAELDEEGKPIVLDVFDSEIIPGQSKQ